MNGFVIAADVNETALAIFGVVVAATLAITYWASKRMTGALQFYAAGRGITGPQNGFAIAGDYMSAASFLGIAGLIFLFGFDGFLYSVGFLVAFLTVLFLLAERMRNADLEASGDPGELRYTRDPEALDAEAAAVADQESELARQVTELSRALTAATGERSAAEEAHRAEEARLAGLVRAADDRREGLARLTGQVNSLRSRAEAADAEIGRLSTAHAEATERAEHATRAFTALETRVAGLDAGVFNAIAAIDTEYAGYLLVALFAVIGISAWILWRRSSPTASRQP